MNYLHEVHRMNTLSVRPPASLTSENTKRISAKCCIGTYTENYVVNLLLIYIDPLLPLLYMNLT